MVPHESALNLLANNHPGFAHLIKTNASLSRKLCAVEFDYFAFTLMSPSGVSVTLDDSGYSTLNAALLGGIGGVSFLARLARANGQKLWAFIPTGEPTITFKNYAVFDSIAYAAENYNVRASWIAHASDSPALIVGKTGAENLVKSIIWGNTAVVHAYLKGWWLLFDAAL